MPDFDQYFSYLRSRTPLGQQYRKLILYPRLSRHLVGRTLDIGCGIGDMLAFRRNTVGVDINPRAVEFCTSRGLDARLMSIDTLPFGDQEFDSTLLDNVLEHLSEPAKLMVEIRRVLKRRSGVLLVGVPGIKGWRSDADHKVFYDEHSLVERISQFGFHHIDTFYTPLFRSSVLDRIIRQYCIYTKFQLSDL